MCYLSMLGLHLIHVSKMGPLCTLRELTSYMYAMAEPSATEEN